jgi:two-component system chemotaxis response regulator CheY
MKILIIDDDFISRNTLHAMLLPYGTCFLAADGETAVEAFASAHEEGEPYELMCVDVQMPGIDGHETLQRIRALETEMTIAEERRVKAIMVTASRDVKDVIAAKELRCDAYLVKPVEKERLLDEIRQLKFNVSALPRSQF